MEKNIKVARLLWRDYIENNTVESISDKAVAYWGIRGFDGRNSGDKVENYMYWYVKNINCIPTLSGECKVSGDVFINGENIKKIAGKYLPVFDGPILSQDWKSFFKFKTNLKLFDYLEILSKISKDLNQEKKIKEENLQRTQDIYNIFLEECDNWSSEDIKKINEWSETGTLLNRQNEFIECKKIKYFIDGNESIFQEQYNFLNLNAKNRNHPKLEKVLEYFNIKILRQNEFELIHEPLDCCENLKKKLIEITPYFKSWIVSLTDDKLIIKKLEDINNKISSIEIFQSEKLEIVYKEIDFKKSVDTHFDKNILYVSNPWDTNSVLLKLPEILCKYFELLGYNKELEFLLRSQIFEIQKYFLQEKIQIIEEVIEETFEEFDYEIDEFSEIKKKSEFHHITRSDFEALKYAETLIERSVKNILKFLEKLPEYDCRNHYKLTRSIIGGVMKNGQEIVILARPSDNNQVLLHYTSEFDVLEHVNAEFWCENGKDIPRKIKLGELLKKTGINRIPIPNLLLKENEFQELLTIEKNNKLDFSPIPYVPEQIAKTIAAFSNTEGGELIFGLREEHRGNNEIVGLSLDFKMENILNKAISLFLTPPDLKYDWIKNNEKLIFLIKVEKSKEEMFLKNKKYIRVNDKNILENESETIEFKLNKPVIDRNITILIGVEEYKNNTIQKVKYANKDIENFKKMLIDVMKIPTDDIIEYKNEEASKNTLKYDFQYLFSELTERDRLIFYYVGHGFHDGITNYLSTYDMYQENIADTSISLREVLLDPLKKSKCKNAIIFIDACAQTFRNENSRNQVSDIRTEELQFFSSENPSYSIFLSCQTGQSSYSCNDLENGIWTYHLLQALNRKITSVCKANCITDRTLQSYLSNSVSKYVKEKLSRKQNPKSILESELENVILDFN